MNILLFEDKMVSRLNPVTLGRPAYEILCGSYRLVDLASRLGDVRALVRPHLKNVVESNYPAIFSPPADNRELNVLSLNARLVPSVKSIERLQSFVEKQEPCIIKSGDSMVAAILPPEKQAAVSKSAAGLKALWDDLPKTPLVEMDFPLFEYPHDIVRYNMAILAENLQDRLEKDAYRKGGEGLFLAQGAQLGEYVTVDVSKGPIILEREASVGPFSYLRGPVYLGAKAKVNEHASLKDGVCLGHTTKVGGEVEASVIEPYSNKQHYGFLGHSYVGSWVNLGAGTCNSDLKNTYGPVVAEYGGQKVDTGMQLYGCAIGDYAKTAIGTCIFTGKTVGFGSMLYGFVTSNVPSFVNYARIFNQMTQAPVEVILKMQERMFARRNVERRECDAQLLRDIFAMTGEERAGVSTDRLSL